MSTAVDANEIIDTPAAAREVKAAGGWQVARVADRLARAGAIKVVRLGRCRGIRRADLPLIRAELERLGWQTAAESDQSPGEDGYQR